MAERLVIIDCGSGNLRSVERAVEAAARDAGLSVSAEISSDPERVAAAERVILPGVGAFRACAEGLTSVDGLASALEHAALVEARPFLGICVGMQLLAERGLEFGETAGLGWIAGTVRPLEPAPGRRIPHMGWNTVRRDCEHGALADLPAADDFYFAHSFHFDVENDAHVLAYADYGGPIAAIVGRDNLLGCQCHPEKSQAAGRRLLTAFLRWRP